MATVPYIHPDAQITPAKGVKTAVTGTDYSGEPVTALYVGGAGDVVIKAIDGSQATFSSVPAGTVLPVRVHTIVASGTTATNMVLLKSRFS